MQHWWPSAPGFPLTMEAKADLGIGSLLSLLCSSLLCCRGPPPPAGPPAGEGGGCQLLQPIGSSGQHTCAQHDLQATPAPWPTAGNIRQAPPGARERTIHLLGQHGRQSLRSASCWQQPLPSCACVTPHKGQHAAQHHKRRHTAWVPRRQELGSGWPKAPSCSDQVTAPGSMHCAHLRPTHSLLSQLLLLRRNLGLVLLRGLQWVHGSAGGEGLGWACTCMRAGQLQWSCTPASAST